MSLFNILGLFCGLIGICGLFMLGYVVGNHIFQELKGFFGFNNKNITYSKIIHINDVEVEVEYSFEEMLNAGEIDRKGNLVI